LKNSNKIKKIYSLLTKAYQNLNPPSVTTISKENNSDPFKVLISCLISLRTKDEITKSVSNRLFQIADTPEKLLEIDDNTLEKVLYPAGFYRKKVKILKEVSKTLLEKYNGKVPDNIEELLTIKGIGRKTANLVVVEGFGKEGICVDTHVHRICNRIGIVNTKTPEHTEMKLREILPKYMWKKWNEILVSYGQNICTPISPKCSTCQISQLCDKIDVKRWR